MKRLSIRNNRGSIYLTMVGHGHYSGRDGSLYTKLDKVTTAKQILEFIVANVE